MCGFVRVCSGLGFGGSAGFDASEHCNPKGPCTPIVYTLAPKYLHRDYFKAKVYTIWVHGPLGQEKKHRQLPVKTAVMHERLRATMNYLLNPKP